MKSMFSFLGLVLVSLSFSATNSFDSDEEEDDDLNFYSSAQSRFKKIKEQMEKEKSERLKILESKLDESIEEDLQKEKMKKSSKKDDKKHEEEEEISTNMEHTNYCDSIIEVSDSPMLIIDEAPSNARITRSASRRGRGARSQRDDVVSVNDTPNYRTKCKNSRKKNLIDRDLEKLDKIANTYKHMQQVKSSRKKNDSPILLLSDSENEVDATEEVVNVKVIWRNNTKHSFPIVRKKDISSIYEFFSKKENVNIENILLTKGDTILSSTSTPLSMELKVIDILQGGILKNDNILPKENNKKDKDCIEIKVQQKNVKKPLLIQLHKSNDMMILAKKVAAELKVSVDKLKFNFDGEPLDLEETVEGLDLEGGECFDLVVFTT